MTLFQKLTLFGVLSPLIALVVAGYAIFYAREDSTGIGISYLVLGFLLVAVVFVLDRLAVRFVPVGWVSGIEAGLLLMGFLMYVYSSQTTTVDLSANRFPYIVLIWVKSPAQSNPLQRTSLVNKTLSVPERQVARLNYTESNQHTITPPITWGNSYFSTGIDLNDPRFVSAYIYLPADHSYSKTQLVHLIHKAVDQQPNEANHY